MIDLPYFLGIGVPFSDPFDGYTPAEEEDYAKDPDGADMVDPDGVKVEDI